ncbi:MAG: CDP-diacylglycerol---glycerol-3-phosphate 3-phosphatidyltransferase [Chloroflexota bacterium]|nr:CDP-diacylglycerol---glycerol-3-phosphate 3-phosphatidyltransferase [Chloroflexota bacterium]
MTFTDRLRKTFANLLNSVGIAVQKTGITPNAITISGVILNFVAATCIASGNLRLGGVIVALSGPLDALDGTLARLNANNRPFGGLLDSVADRFSEIAIMFGLLLYFFNQGHLTGVVLVFVALSGSVMVSYVRARAQSLGCDPKLGILTRVERYIITSLCLLLAQPLIGLWLLAIFTYVTVFQRIWFAWKELH